MHKGHIKMIDNNAHVLIIYTGGTIGMVENVETGIYEPFNFSHLRANVPEMKRLKFKISTHLFESPLDSSEITPEKWIELVTVIQKNYKKYDGFVILHGTDTMAYTASALSFMFENLTKPIILTGSQLPIGKLRTDGKENIITALEIAADKHKSTGKPLAPEVSIFFQNLLMRGNRTTKINANNFNAFNSANYPLLGESGVTIRYELSHILSPDYNKATRFYTQLNPHVTVLKLFPGITEEVLRATFNINELQGVVLETYGMGNALRNLWFTNIIKEAVSKGIIVVNVSQCLYGKVEMNHYETGQKLLDSGVISGFDLTTEAALAKLMYLFGNYTDRNQIKYLMQKPLRGELAIEE